MIARRTWRNWCRTLGRSTWQSPRRSRQPHRVWAADQLEERTLLSTITVTTNLEHEDGKVSLREAVDSANNADGFDEIEFDPSLNSLPFEITEGQIFITDTVSITGRGARLTVLDAVNESRVFTISESAGDVTLSALTITGGRTEDEGQAGGGIRSFTPGLLTIDHSTISGNATAGDLSSGGGLYATGGNVTVIASTISGNSTSVGFSNGGGIAIYGGDLELINSTVTGNSTGFSGHGGAIDARDANVTVISSTISDNFSPNPGGGMVVTVGFDNFPTSQPAPQADSLFLLTLENSIVSGNHNQAGFADDIFLYAFDGYDTSLVDITASYSLIGVNSGTTLAPAPVGNPDANGNLVGTHESPLNPILGPPQDNGGPTDTMLLLVDSPAIDAGGPTDLLHDQRGLKRVFGGTVDMGALEVQPAEGTLIDTTPISTVEATEGGKFCTVIMTFTDTDTGHELDASYYTVTVDWGTTVVDTVYTVQFVSSSPEESHWQVLAMGTFPVGSASGSPYIPLVTVEDAADNSVSTSNTTFNVVPAQSPLRLLHRQTGLAGFYYVIHPVGEAAFEPDNPEDVRPVAEVLQNGARLTLVDTSGQTAEAAITNNTDITIVDSFITAQFFQDDGTIEFSDGTVWVKIRQIAGQWLTTGEPETGESSATPALPPGTGVGGIRQLGPALYFTDAQGNESVGLFTSATTVVATDWNNLEGELTLDGRQIEWEDGTVWNLIPDFAGSWANGIGQPLRVEQQGEKLLFINRFGQTSLGEYIGVDEVDSGETWGHRIGHIVGETIEWDNQTVWAIPNVSPQFPDLGGLWEGAEEGSTTRVLQAVAALTFVNRFGDSTPGVFMDETRVYAIDWQQEGMIVGNEIHWQNTTVWTIYPTLAGPYFDDTNVETGVNQFGRSLTFTDRDGIVTHGTLLTPTTIEETDGAHRTATIDGDVIEWSDDAVWTKLPLLWGNWQDDGDCGPTYVEQMGYALLFIDPFGDPLAGFFVTPTEAEMDYDEGPTVDVEIISKDKMLLTVAGDSDEPQPEVGAQTEWNRFPPNLLDNVFANPNFWPYL